MIEIEKNKSENKKQEGLAIKILEKEGQNIIDFYEKKLQGMDFLFSF